MKHDTALFVVEATYRSRFQLSVDRGSTVGALGSGVAGAGVGALDGGVGGGVNVSGAPQSVCVSSLLLYCDTLTCQHSRPTC